MKLQNRNDSVLTTSVLFLLNLLNFFLLRFFHRCCGRRRRTNHGVRLQANVRRVGRHGHRFRPCQNGHSARVGFHRPAGGAGRSAQGDGPVVRQPAIERNRGDGRRPGGRHGGHAGGRGRVAVAQSAARRERDQGHQTYEAVLRRRRARLARRRVNGAQHSRSAMGRARQPSRPGAGFQAQKDNVMVTWTRRRRCRRTTVVFVTVLRRVVCTCSLIF